MHSERQHRVSLHSERQQQPSLAGILAQPQQQNAPEKTLSVIDPLSQKINIPVSAISETRAVYREGTQSLCLLFFEGRCRLANDCNQIHADPTTVNELRVVANNLPTCCKYHGDANNHRFDRYPEWADRTLIVDGVVIPVDFVAFTIGLERSLNQSTSNDVNHQQQQQQQQFDDGNAGAADGGAQKPSKSVVISPTFVCRLQAGGHCRYHDECKFIHLCREVTTQHLSRSVIPLATDLERKHRNSQAALRHGGSGGASPPSFAGQQQQQQQQHRHNNRHQQREYGGSPVVMVSTTGELLQQPHQVGFGVGGSSPPPPPPPPPQYVLASAAPQGIASAGSNGTSSQLQQQTDLPLNLQALLPAAAKVAAPAAKVAPTEAPAGSWSVTSSSVTPAPVPGPTISAGKIQQPVKFTSTGATDVTPPPTTQESLLKSTQFQLHQASDSAAQSDVRISALVQSAAANRNTEEGLQQKLKLLSNTTMTNGHSSSSPTISQNGGGVAVVSQAILQVGQGMGESAQRDQQLKDSVLAILAELSYREQLRDELGKQMKQTAAAVSALAVANQQQQQQQQQPPPQPENEGGSDEAVSADLLRLLAE